MKKVCVVTATRAEYGLLRRIIQEILNDSYLELCLVVTGTHLSHKYGYTIQEIYDDNYPIAEIIDIMSEEDSCIGICNTMGKAMQQFADVYERQKPDMLLVLGDRYELIPICSSAMIFGIPIAHVSGGELTEGSVDDAVRHCITKMSYLHFPACETYRKRIIQLGESPDRVFNYGDVGVENIKKSELIPIEELSKNLGIELKHYASVTFHPVTLENETFEEQVNEMIAAMRTFDDILFVVTLSNADLNGSKINRMFEESARKHSNIKCFMSLGIKKYLSLISNSLFVMGNSSSGIIEAPSLGIPTINIGDRQKGRMRAKSVIDCLPTKECIEKSIKKAISHDFRKSINDISNPYGEGDVAKNIVSQIHKTLEVRIDLKKKFYDCEFIGDIV